MKVLVLNQFFHPDLSSTAQIATELAVDLAKAGLEVTALAARGSYLGGGRLPAEEIHEGVRIVRVPCSSLGKKSIARRLCDYGSFLASSAAWLASQAPHDLVLAMSTPPMVATMAAVMRRGKTRFAYWVQDLYPDVAVELGVLERKSPATRALDAAARWTLRRADVVIALGEEMARRLSDKGVPRSRLRIVPNWADGGLVRPVPRESNKFLKEHGLTGKRVALYSGNMGRGHDIRTLLDAARASSADDIVFVFVGDGAKRAEVELLAREQPNVKLLPYQPKERLAESLSAGDVHLVAQDANTLGLIEPSKLYGILAAGRPVLYVGPARSEVAQTIVRERIGRVVENGDVAGTSIALRELLSDANALGQRARAAHDREYDRRHRTAQFLEVLRGAV